MNNLFPGALRALRQSIGIAFSLLLGHGVALGAPSPQTIAWTSPTNAQIVPLNSPVPLVATASSGLPVTYSVQAGPAEIAGGLVTATNIGTVTLLAAQAGDATYAPTNATVTVNRSAAQLRPVGRWPMSFNGEAIGVVLVGHLAYVAAGGAGLVILDVSNPGAPTVAGSYNTPSMAWAVDVVGNFAYVADGHNGLVILNVTNPANPVLAGGLDTPGNAYGVQVVGNFAYVADSDRGLQIVDVSNPASAFLAGSRDTPGNAWGVTVVGNLAYVADQTGGVQILNVSNPGNITPVGTYDTPGWVQSVDVVGDLAFLADYDGGLVILNVSNPAAPVLVGSHDTGGLAYGIQVVGNLAYIADEAAGLQVFDISNPGAPFPAGSYNTPGQVRGVLVADGLAYLADWKQGVQVLETGEFIGQAINWAWPTNGAALLLNQPYPLTAAASSGLPVTFRVESGPAAIADGSVTVTNLGAVVLVAEQAGDSNFIAVSEPCRVNVSSYQVASAEVWPGLTNSVYGICLAGSKAYLATGPLGLLIYDLSDPAAPAYLGRYDSSGFAEDVKVVGNLAYLTDGDVGLHILDVSNPAAPVRVGGFATQGYADALDVAGEHAYVVAGSRVEIIRVSNPAAPVRASSAAGTGASTRQDVQVVGNFLYLTTIWDGLHIFDVTNPANPVFRGTVTHGGWGAETQVVGNLAYIATLTEGLKIVDVSNPAIAVMVGTYAARNFNGVQVIGSLAYLSCFGNQSEEQLLILDLADLAAPVRVGGYGGGIGLGAFVVRGDLAFVNEGLSMKTLHLREGIARTLTFDPPARLPSLASPYALSATVDYGTVVFTVVSGPATVMGNQLSLTGGGTVVVRAEVAGDAQFLPVAQERTIVVEPPFTLSLPRFQAGDLVLTWSGGTAPFTVLRRESLDAAPTEAGVTSEHTLTVPADTASGFFQIRGAQ